MSLRNVMNFIDLAKAKTDEKHGQWASDEELSDADRIERLEQRLADMETNYRELKTYFGAALRMLMIRDVFTAREVEEFVTSISDASKKYANGHDLHHEPRTNLTDEIDTDAIAEAIDDTPLSDTFFRGESPES